MDNLGDVMNDVMCVVLYLRCEQAAGAMEDEDVRSLACKLTGEGVCMMAVHCANTYWQWIEGQRQ